MDFDYLKQKRILLVDDEQELLDMVSSIFANEGFCNVKTAKTVKEALCIAETFQPELAILDVMLPDGNGFDLMKQLKIKSDYPVLFLTARGEDDDKFRGFGLGADDYMVKPFEMLELLVRIEKVLERNGRVNSLIQIYDVVIDTEKRTVTKDGQEVYLKPMEYECLLLFVRHKNKALTRKQILGTLWGMEFEGETRTVDAHVGRIRKKLGWGNIIKTIPTVGYRLEVDE